MWTYFARPLNLAAMFFLRFGPMNLRKKKETFDIYELSSHQRHFNLSMDEFQSSYSNWKCDEDNIYLFIC